jgi:hypothetical protein
MIDATRDLSNIFQLDASGTLFIQATLRIGVCITSVSKGFTIICPTCHVIFTINEDNETLVRILVYIDDCPYVTTSETTRKFPKAI